MLGPEHKANSSCKTVKKSETVLAYANRITKVELGVANGSITRI
jgi:hypothetical protein